jgi:hypothetical protein
MPHLTDETVRQVTEQLVAPALIRQLHLERADFTAIGVVLNQPAHGFDHQLIPEAGTEGRMGCLDNLTQQLEKRLKEILLSMGN